MLRLIQNKALAAAGSPAEEDPRTRFYPAQVDRPRLLAWLGFAAGVVVLVALLWIFVVGG